jgi:hypothetical protein
MQKIALLKERVYGIMFDMSIVAGVRKAVHWAGVVNCISTLASIHIG